MTPLEFVFLIALAIYGGFALGYFWMYWQVRHLVVKDNG
jgi:hypothetical protein